MTTDDLEGLPGFAPKKAPSVYEGDDDDGDIFKTLNVKLERDVDFDGLLQPWMKFHEFKVIKTLDELDSIIEDAFRTGKCALDLETEGLDNRIYLHPPSTPQIERWWEGEGPELVPLTNDKVVGYCLSTDGHTGYYVPVRHKADGKNPNLDLVEVGRRIQRLCQAAQPELTPEGYAEDPLASRKIAKPGRVKIFFWNAKFDQEFLYPITGIDYWHPDSFEDGMLQYFCIYTDDKELSLKTKSEKKLVVRDKQGKEVLGEDGKPIPYKMIELKALFAKGRKIDFPALDPIEARHYACSDAICTFLHGVDKNLQETLLHAKYSNIYRLEKQVTQVVRVMERNRIKIDVEYVKNLLKEAQEESERYRVEIVSLAETYGFKNFDPNSPKQLSDFLFAHPQGLKLEPKPEMNEKSGQFKTDADTLEELANHPNTNPVLLTIVKYRQVEKVIGTYLTNMTRNVDHLGEVRYQFKQVGAATGRFSAPTGGSGESATSIPVHGIPATYDDKKPKVATSLRRAFIPREGKVIVKIDYSGEELRIVTNLSKEPVWIKEFNQGSGDLHTITARAFFNKQEVTKQERQAGKSANFSLVYGGGTQAIMRATGCDKMEASRRKANFDKSLPVFATWTKKQKTKVKMEKGVFTAFGRWIAIPEIDHGIPAIVAGAERKSINYPIQGSGADIMKLALVFLHREFHKRGWLQSDVVRIMLTVHDEIVFEVRYEYIMEAIPLMEELMTLPSRMAKWEVPLTAEPLVDLSWDAKYDFNKMVHGEHKPEKPGDKPLKKDELRVGDRVYQAVPDFLASWVVPDYIKKGEVPVTPRPAVEAPKTVVEAPKAVVEAPKPTRAATASTLPSEPPKGTRESEPPIAFGMTDEPFTRAITTINARSVKVVSALLHEAWDEDGPPLHLIDYTTGETLIDPSQGFRINPVLFSHLLDKSNL